MRFFGQSFVQEMCARNVLRIEQNFFVHFAKKHNFEKKYSRIIDLKENIKKKIEKINQFIDKLKENDISFNYLE